MITPDEAINKAYAELLEREPPKTVAVAYVREVLSCCVCGNPLAYTDFFDDLTDEEYENEAENDQYCGRSPRCCP